VPELGQVPTQPFASRQSTQVLRDVLQANGIIKQAQERPCCFLVTLSALYIQENSSQLGNLAAGSNKALPSAKRASKKDSRPTCLDGLWEILQHAEELLPSQPDVVAHTLRLLAVMWQVLFPLPPCQPSMFVAESSASVASLVYKTH